MTVGELLAELLQAPMDCEVLILTDDGDGEVSIASAGWKTYGTQAYAHLVPAENVTTAAA